VIVARRAWRALGTRVRSHRLLSRLRANIGTSAGGLHEQRSYSCAIVGRRCCVWRTGAVIASGLRIHQKLGPGLLESVYEAVIARDLVRLGLSVERQKDGIRRIAN
jgi:hypothetical protein